MTIYSTLQIGEYHLNHCEDYLLTEEIGNDKLICAVMDGCTMGTESYFASTLVGRILKKIAKTRGYKELYGIAPSPSDIDDHLRSILKELFAELNIVKSQLLLDQKELLTTLIILLIDKKQQQGIVLTIGDGLVAVNGIITEFDQDNKPDYLGFHLHEDFDTWYDKQQQKITFDKINDISIATDGILSFIKIAAKDNPEEVDPIHFLVEDRTTADQEEMLNMKLKKLEHTYGLKPSDDIAVIRIITQPPAA